MRDALKRKLQSIEEMLCDPFNPYPLEKAIEGLMDDLKNLSTEEAQEIYKWLNYVYQRLEENHKIALGWLEDVAKWGEKGDIKA